MITDRSREPEAAFRSELARIEAQEVAPESYACTCGHDGLAAEWHADGCGKPTRERWIDSPMRDPWFRDLIAGTTAQHAADLRGWAERVAFAYSKSGTLEVTAVVWALLDALDRNPAEASGDVVERVAWAMKLWDGTTSSDSSDEWFRGLARAALTAMHDRDGQR